MKKFSKIIGNKGNDNSEKKEYTIRELIELGEKNNVIRLAENSNTPDKKKPQKENSNNEN